jgi:pyruvate dehydrogenase E2 component (dihydrolipoamide acetyltransferase)
MSTDIVMPKLSDTMEEGTILKWLKQVGDTVTAGEVIAEVETDKADMELEASEGGVLSAIQIPAGQSAAVGAVIAVLDGGAARQADGAAKQPRSTATGVPEAVDEPGAERDDESGAGAEEATVAGSEEATAARKPEAASQPRTSAPPAKPAARSKAATPSDAQARSRPADGKHVAANDAPRADAIKASAAARALAAERGIDLAGLRGSGPDGRIVSEDVETAASASSPPESRAPATRRPPSPGGDAPVSERHELSRMRQSIAKRMSEAFRDIPHFAVTAEIDMSEAVRLKAALEKSEAFDVPVTYTHMVLKAVARALTRHPRLNSSYRDGALEVHAEVNLGMAVSVDDGLIVPVLRNADARSLADLAAEARRLVALTKQGKFASADLSGGTFTVSNMGMLDLESFTAVINPPQAAILAVGAIKPRAVVRDGAVVARHTMFVTVSCDHRIIDGVMAGRFLEELKTSLENPIGLVVA